jgi:hypothetical protein
VAFILQHENSLLNTKVYLQDKKIIAYFASRIKRVPWPSGLGTGLQNQVRRFESARNLIKALDFSEENRELFVLYRDLFFFK